MRGRSATRLLAPPARCSRATASTLRCRPSPPPPAPGRQRLSPVPLQARPARCARRRAPARCRARRARPRSRRRRRPWSALAGLLWALAERQADDDVLGEAMATVSDHPAVQRGARERRRSARAPARRGARRGAAAGRRDDARPAVAVRRHARGRPDSSRRVAADARARDRRTRSPPPQVTPSRCKGGASGERGVDVPIVHRLSRVIRRTVVYGSCRTRKRPRLALDESIPGAFCRGARRELTRFPARDPGEALDGVGQFLYPARPATPGL